MVTIENAQVVGFANADAAINTATVKVIVIGLKDYIRIRCRRFIFSYLHQQQEL